MAKPSKKQSKSLIKPLIKVAGEQHLFEELAEAGELPIIKSIGYTRIAPNSKDYVSYVITSRGREVISIEVSEPNARFIAADETKLNFMTEFEDSDEAFQQDARQAAIEDSDESVSDD